MSYWLLAGVSTFAAFSFAAAWGMVAARLGARLVARRVAAVAATPRAQLLFGLRMLPIFAGAIGGFAVALPIFLWFENPDTIEAVNRTLAVAAAAGVLLVATGIWRAASAWHATNACIAAWQKLGRRIDGLTTNLPAYAIDEAFPTVAVAGILRPHLFISERVLRDFTSGEVAAMVAHECAHVSACDNVKRLLMSAAPFGAPAIERAWAAAAEEAADARAASLGPSAGADLAQALIRVARLAAPSSPRLASAFYLGGSIETRVRRLVDPPPAADSIRWMRVALPLAATLFAAAVILGAPTLHSLMEQAVLLLP